jgi:PAS domain S-box-containing protein
VDALELLGRAMPPLVVLEDPLADMSAVEFCRMARALPAGEDAVLLVISNRDDELSNVLDAGATDLYTTTLGPAALEARILIAERLVLKHAKLRDRELRFRRLFEAGIAGVVISDLAGNFKEANPAFLRMLGYTREDMLAGVVDWEAITPPHRLVPDVEERAQLRATGFLPLVEREYIHKNGTRVAVLVGSVALEEPFRRAEILGQFASIREKNGSASVRWVCSSASSSSSVRPRPRKASASLWKGAYTSSCMQPLPCRWQRWLA